MKQVSSLMDGAFSCYSVLTTLPYIFKQNKCNKKVVKVILELGKLDLYSCNIQEHSFLTYIYVYKSYLGPIAMSFMLHFKLLP